MLTKRVAIILLLTLLPWPAVWYGMYEIRSIVWTFFLYHVICLLPAIIIGHGLWKDHLALPTRRQIAILLASAIGISTIGTLIYNFTGSLVVDREEVLETMTARGYQATWILPLSFYFIFINATLEELFWRGVVLNELDHLNKHVRHAGTVWTAVAFGAWHWLVFRVLVRPGWAEISVLALMGVGLGASWLYRKTNSLVLPILWHAFVVDLAAIVVFVALQDH